MSAKPRGLDDGLTEIVTVLDIGLAEAHADPHTELLLGVAVARLHGLLHLDRACKRLRGAGEHHHQPIAKILHLTTTRLFQRPPQHPEVLLAQFLRRRRADTVRSEEHTSEL